MSIFDSITTYLSYLLGIILFIGLLLHLYKNRKSKEVWKRFAFRSLIISGIVFIPIWFMNSSIGERITQDYNIEYTSTTTIEAESKDSIPFKFQYFEQIGFYHYLKHKTRHVNRPLNTFIDDYRSIRLLKDYQSYKSSEDSLTHDIGYLFTAFHYVNLELHPQKVLSELREIYNKDIPYYNYVVGTNELHKHSWSAFEPSEQNLLSSISKNECPSLSYIRLSELYYSYGKQEKLNALIDNPETEMYVLEWMKRKRYLEENNWIEYWKVRLEGEFDYWHVLGVAGALVLLLLWMYYLRKLDIYEPEKKRYLLLTFVLAVISMQLLYPLHDVLVFELGYYRPSRPISDLWYCVISIGMLEELVKIIPVLLVLKFTKQINEPFDYILYAAVAGLGFSFIENIGYFGEDILNISGRGIYCCLAHMAFSATIGYGLMLAKYRGYNKYLMFVIFFILASFLHGFYDFWILDWWASEYGWVSDLTFMLCIYLFAYYANNTLNNTTFYNRKITLKTDQIKFTGLIVALGVLMCGYIMASIYYGAEQGFLYLEYRFTYLSFYIFFIILTFGSMKIMRGHLSPLQLPLRNLFREKKSLTDLSGHELQFSVSQKFTIDPELLTEPMVLNQIAQIKERTVVDENLNSYTIELETAIEVEDHEGKLLLAIPHWDKGTFMSRKKVLTNLFLIRNESDIDQPFLREDRFTYLGKVFGKRMT